MDLKPGESKEFQVESPVPLDQLKSAVLEFGWKCAGCGHDHKKYIEVQRGNFNDIEIDIACPCCTPWWMKFRNLLRRLIKGD